MRTLGLLVATALLAPAAHAQFMPPPTCYDTRCKLAKKSEPRDYVVDDSADLAKLSQHTQLSVGISHIELTAIDVRIPKPPYGVTGRGTCRIRFDLDRNGHAENVEISRCPRPYADTIRDSSANWRYAPVLDATGTPMPVRKASMLLPWQSWQETVPGI